MSDLAVHARGLKKVYRLYEKPRHRLLDMVGLLDKLSIHYSEHAALDGIDLDIRQGEKVAIIGRNGAGKSTLLKLITQVTEPNGGTLEVSGETQALLQIGTGFHPEFTGRENVLSYLTYLGVADGELDRKVAEIVEFAEIEEYIDQPVKTYSTGMEVRLMFAATTAIEPKILVIDEVLGVGDAYFSYKSFQRIEELCAREGTTVLLVSHDIYGAARLCDRMIWIDRGRIVVDDDSANVIKAYELSIREQEERRMRAGKARWTESRTSQLLFVEIHAHKKIPLKAPVYISEISLTTPSGETVATIPLESDSTGWDEGHHIIAEGSAWGNVRFIGGKPARLFLNFGSSFHKVASAIDLVCLGPGDRIENMLVRLETYSEKACDLEFRAYLGERLLNINTFRCEAGIETRETFPLRVGQDLAMPIAEISDFVFGTGDLWITEAGIYDDNGRDIRILEHGRNTELRLTFDVVNPEFDGKVRAVFAFHRDGVQAACRLLSKPFRVRAASMAAGRLRFSWRDMPLPVGEFTMTVMLVGEDHFTGSGHPFYTVNPNVYCCLGKIIRATVECPDAVAQGSALVFEVECDLEPGKRTGAVEDVDNTITDDGT